MRRIHGDTLVLAIGMTLIGCSLFKDSAIDETCEDLGTCEEVDSGGEIDTGGEGEGEGEG